MARIKDIRNTWGMPGLQKVIAIEDGHLGGRTHDPLDEALADRRAVLASFIQRSAMDTVEDAAETERMEKRTTRLEAELHLQEIERKLAEQRGNGTADGTHDILLGFLNLLNEDKKTLAAERDGLIERLQEVNAETVRRLSEQVAQTHSTGNGQAPDRTALQQISQAVQEAKSVSDLVKGLVPTPAEPAGQAAQHQRSIEEEVRLMEAREQHEFRMYEMDLRREELRRQGDLAWAKFDQEKTRSAAVAETLQQYAPAAIEALRTGFRERSLAAGADQAARAAARQMADGSPPPGHAEPCPACGTPVELAPGQSIGVCPKDDCRTLVQVVP